MQPEAHALASRCLEGNAGAWEEFVGAYTPAVEAAIGRVLARLQAPVEEPLFRELVQSVFTYLWKADRAALRAFRWRAPLEKYLSAIAAHCAVTWARSTRRAARLENVWAHQALERDLLGSQAANSMLMEGPEALERKAHMWRALDLLPETERLAIRLVYWDGLDLEQTGRLLELSVESTRELLAQARRRLKEMLEDPLSRL